METWNNDVIINIKRTWPEESKWARVALRIWNFSRVSVLKSVENNSGKDVELGWLMQWSHCLHQFSQFSRSVVSDSSRPHGPQHTRHPCPSPTLGVYSNSCPLSRWCHPTISPSVVPFSSCLQSFPASGPFLMSQFFASGGQSIGVSASASALPMNHGICPQINISSN